MSADYDYFSGDDPDIAKWGPKRTDDEFLEINCIVRAGGVWKPVGATGSFLPPYHISLSDNS